jgi:uncharacterized membrane protein
MAADMVPAVREEFMRLLEAPEDRIEDISLWFLEGGRAAEADELGSEEIADVIWDNIADLQSLSFSELASRPVDVRGDTWAKAAGVMVASALRQANITKGPAIPAMLAGIQHGAVRVQDLGAINASDLKGKRFEIKRALANEKVERESRGTSG